METLPTICAASLKRHQALVNEIVVGSVGIVGQADFQDCEIPM
jgi:hypothetical protein